MTNITIPKADYESNRAALKDFYRQQGVFSDIDFDGSFISALVDGLAYNTTIGNFYYNMAVNETRSDTARARYSVIAKAQENGYVAKSFSSPTAVVEFTITSNDRGRSAIVIPAGTVVTGTVDQRLFSFSTLQPVVTTVTNIDQSTITFSSGPVTIAEGITTSDSFVFSDDVDLYEITNQQVDISSLSVSVVEDNSSITKYTRSSTVVGIDGNTNAYFVRISPSGNYVVYFGDGVTGRRPNKGAVIVIDYRVSNGQLANALSKFTPGQPIDGETNIVVSTITPAQGGDVYEDIDSIRFNGQQAAITQQRSIYEDDFAADIQQNFPIIADINVVGGENITPPQYGKIIITAVDKQLNNLTSVELEDITAFINKRKPTTTSVVFNKAAIFRVGVSTTLTTTGGVTNAIKTAVVAAIENYSNASLSKFGQSAFRSRLETAIDNAAPSIVSNTTTLTLLNQISTGSAASIATNNPIKSVYSAPVLYNGVTGTIVDNNGFLYIVDTNRGVISDVVGTVDYQNGVITVYPINTKYVQAVDLIITPVSANIIATGNVVLKIISTDISIG